MERSYDTLPENAFVTDLLGARQASLELNSRQRSSGASGQLGYMPQNPGSWDRTETVTAQGSSGGYSFADVGLSVTFTGDGSQQWPSVVPLFDLFFNGTSNSNRLAFQPGGGLYLWTDATTSAMSYAPVSDDLTLLEDPIRLRWNVFVSLQWTAAAPTYYFKARGAGSCPGTWTIVRTV